MYLNHVNLREVSSNCGCHCSDARKTRCRYDIMERGRLRGELHLHREGPTSRRRVRKQLPDTSWEIVAQEPGPETLPRLSRGTQGLPCLFFYKQARHLSRQIVPVQIYQSSYVMFLVNDNSLRHSNILPSSHLSSSGKYLTYCCLIWAFPLCYVYVEANTDTIAKPLGTQPEGSMISSYLRFPSLCSSRKLHH